MMHDSMYGTNPVLEIDDMLPGVSDENNTPGLTLGYIPMPCLSIVIWRCNVIICADDSDAAGAGAVLMHSPELPQFPFTIERIDITRTRVLENGAHTPQTRFNTALSNLKRVRIDPTRTTRTLSDQSHYQPVNKQANQSFSRFQRL